jgi:hypothetical protein
MPTSQIPFLISMLLFVAGALLIVSSNFKRTLLEGYAAWMVATLIMAIGFYAEPKTLAPVIAMVTGLGDSIADPTIAIAIFCGAVLMATVILALLEKNARMFAKPLPLDEIYLGMPEIEPQVKRSSMRRVMDALMFRKPAKPEAAEVPNINDEIANNGGSAWSTMLKNERIRDAFGITPEEEQMLSQVSFMGEVSSPHDLRLVLNALRGTRSKLMKETTSGARAAAASAPGERPSARKPTS